MKKFLGQKRKAKNIEFDFAFGPGFDSEFSAKENNDWLRQFVRGAFSKTRGYLVEGDESYPLAIWEQTNTNNESNNLNTTYELIWIES